MQALASKCNPCLPVPRSGARASSPRAESERESAHRDASAAVGAFPSHARIDCFVMQASANADASNALTENPLGHVAVPTSGSSAAVEPGAVADVEIALTELAKASPDTESVRVMKKVADALAAQQDATAASAFALSSSAPTNWHQVWINVD